MHPNRVRILWVTMSRFSNIVTFVVLLNSAAGTLEPYDTTEKSDSDRHECLRPCESEQSSKKICRYEFIVDELPFTSSIRKDSKVKDGVATGKERTTGSFLGVNGKSPGPRIEVCVGDTIEVVLHNRLGTEELSLHWHGLRQKGSVHMDGVPMVTQCSILPYGRFRYRLKPEAIGTYFYHAHSVSQQGDGVYGSLTVRGPRDDPTLERTFLLSSRPASPLSRYSHLYTPTPDELLVNGQNGGTILRVRQGTRYLFRLINANAFNCPVLLSTSGHTFRVVSTDGNLVQSMKATHTVSFPGERLDIVLEANQPAGRYLVEIRGLQDCQNLRHEVIIQYDEAETDAPVIKDRGTLKINDYVIANRGYNCDEISKRFICALDLTGTTDILSENDVDDVIYIPFDVNSFPTFTDAMTDNRYNFYPQPFYPAYLSRSKNEIKIGQINGVTFKYPSSPIFSQPENTPEELICSLDERSTDCTNSPLFCECIQIVEIAAGKFVEIILIDEGAGGNVSHTFHMHGYNASIVGRGNFGHPITRQEITTLNNNGKLPRNLKNPPRKDTFVVPNKGYVILRFLADNLGYWLVEARSTAICPGTLGPGMQFLMRVGDRESFHQVPIDFPTCSNNKGPDLVFHSN